MKHEILIEPIFRSVYGLPFRRERNYIVQLSPFELGFKITNKGNQPIKNVSFKDVRISSEAGQNLEHTFPGEYDLGVLNPKESKKIWVDRTGTHINGQVSIKFNISSTVTEDVVQAFQKDVFTEVESPITDVVNRWFDFRYVKSRAEYIQEKLGIATMVLSGVMFLLTVSNLLLSFVTQYIPFVQERTKQANALKKYCADHPDVDGVAWSYEKGIMIPCSEVNKNNASN